MKKICILGATGSIGVNTLDVIAQHTERFQVCALTARSNYKRLFTQCQQFQPDYAVLTDPHAAHKLTEALREAGSKTCVLNHQDALVEVASADDVDMVMAGIVGAAGLLPTLAAVKAGKRVLLANKESLVMAGSLFIQAVQEHDAEIIPVDSEHNAIFQCMPPGFHVGGTSKSSISKIILTASGGPFRQTPLNQMHAITPEQAVAHPKWKMGQKISVDSATMMNKGLEVIEAYWLFNVALEQIDVVLHPQSMIHSMVEYSDGSVLAELGNPDMRTPIACALTWPERIKAGVKSLDLIAAQTLEFETVDMVERYPCLRLAYSAIQAGGTAPVVLNASNEIAVDSFLDRKIRFTEIATTVAKVLDSVETNTVKDLNDILTADHTAREKTKQFLQLLA